MAGVQGRLAGAWCALFLWFAVVGILDISKTEKKQQVIYVAHVATALVGSLACLQDRDLDTLLLKGKLLPAIDTLRGYIPLSGSYALWTAASMYFGLCSLGQLGEGTLYPNSHAAICHVSFWCHTANTLMGACCLVGKLLGGAKPAPPQKKKGD
mmetsp:Transcript_61636/g.173836  ORF Transcript_61636/g.173836 Transcript_61636/m.173836 type:complete len:154 (-) Transcript_61636:192-653(-)